MTSASSVRSNAAAATPRVGAPVTVMIFTLNEEIHLPSCLDSLTWCDDVIVVDSFSSDGTVRIARERGARIFQHAFEGFGSQRNWALDHASPRHEWILILDADERVTPELEGELRRILTAPAPSVGAYRVKRRFHMWGRWLRYSSLYPSWVVRLVHRDRVRYIDRGHAETQRVEGEVRELTSDLIDENLRGIDEWFARQNRYARQEAEYELEQERTPLRLGDFLSRDPLRRRAALRCVLGKAPGRSLAFFLYSYVLRGGFRDGRDGLAFCRMKALYQGMIVARKHDATRSRRGAAGARGPDGERANGPDTTLLKALGALLVANSHLEQFYPHAWMAGDGLLGNSLFFLLAGHGLVRSDRLRPRTPLSWMWRRVVRLYPTLLIVVPVASLLLGGAWRVWQPADYFASLVWPTRFTFVQLVVPFYLLFFPLMRLRRRAVLGWAMVLALVPYLAAYVPDALGTSPGEALHLGTRPLLVHASAYFQVMLLGGWLAWRDGAPRRPLASWLTLAVAVSAAYVALKLAMVGGVHARGYALLHLLTLVWCLTTFELLGLPRLVEGVRARAALWRAGTLIGGLSLEIYVVHSYVADHRWVRGVRFPLDLALFWLLTLTLAWVAGRLVTPLQRWLRGGEAPRSASESPLTDVVLETPIARG